MADDKFNPGLTSNFDPAHHRDRQTPTDPHLDQPRPDLRTSSPWTSQPPPIPTQPPFSRPDAESKTASASLPPFADHLAYEPPAPQRGLDKNWWAHFIGGVMLTASIVATVLWVLDPFSQRAAMSARLPTIDATGEQSLQTFVKPARGVTYSQSASLINEPVSPTAEALANKFAQSSSDKSQRVLDGGAGTEPTPPASPPANAAPPQNLRPAAELSATPTPIATPVRGVNASEIRFGISAPFSGPNKELGYHMKLGIESAFNQVNTRGGVHNRKLKLVSVDDGYEPTRTAEAMKQLYETDQVFGIIGSVGTPTAAVALPFALERQMLFYGPFTGANLLRRDPPDRYVFNTRASYAEETEAAVQYLIKQRRLRPDQIAVFAQQDSFGDSGFAGVAKAMRTLREGADSSILRLNYKRNSLDIDDALLRLKQNRTPIKAVVMIATYRAAAKFIGKIRDYNQTMLFTNVSFVGSTALAEELMLMGPRFASGVIVTQVVPAVESYSSIGLDYKAALAASFPGETPNYVSFEGFVSAKILVEALRRAGPQLDTEKTVEALEAMRDYEIGIGATVTFGPSEHQGLHKVWGTQLDADGRYNPIDLQ